MSKSYLDTILPDGLMPRCRLLGTSKAVLDFILMLANTEPIEVDSEWWQVRIYILNYRN